MTIKEAQEILKVSKQRVYVLLRKHQIELTQESIERYMANKKNGRPKTKKTKIDAIIEKYENANLSAEEKLFLEKIKKELCQ